MAEGLVVAAVLLVLLVILPGMLSRVRTGARNRTRAEVLLSADNARAQATLTYYNEVHDSHSG